MNVEIVKINSHCGITENHTVDFIARRAAEIAKDCKYGRSDYMTYNTYFNPVHVDINIDMKRLKYKHRQDRIKEWKYKHQEWINGHINENYYNGNMIFYKMIFGHNGIVKNGIIDMTNELKYLKPSEASIITKLRTECINLNGYKHFRFKDINNGHDELCQYCKVQETVQHYLIDCPGQTKKLALETWLSFLYNISPESALNFYLPNKL